jgi:hypothetical protein
MLNPELMAAWLLDMDEPVGVNSWPLSCYVTEAVENEMAVFTAAELAKSWEDRFRLTLRRAINVVSVYAEQWGIDTQVLRAAMNTRRI